MKLRSKVLVFVLVPMMLFFVGMIAYVSNTVHQMEIKNAEDMLEAEGNALAQELGLQLTYAMSSAQTLAQSLQGAIESGQQLSREDAINMLRQLIENNRQFVTAWMFWKPDGFDGKDEEYVNEPGHDATGQFIPIWIRTEEGNVLQPLKDYDSIGLKERFEGVFQSGENTISEPFTYELEGKDVTVTSIIAPIVIDGQTAGMVGVDISLDDMNLYVNGISFYDTGFAGLLTNRGTVVSHRDESLIGTNYLDSVAMQNEAHVDSVREAIQIGRQLKFEGYSDTLNENVYHLFTPVAIWGVKSRWSALIVVPSDEVTLQAKRLTITIITTTVIVTFILAALIMLTTRMILYPIRTAVGYGQDMAAGNFTRQLTKRDVKRKDEMGELMRIFDSISGSMRELIGQVKQSADKVLRSTDTLDVSTRQATIAVNEVASAIDEVAQSAENQMQRAEESAKSIEEMSFGVQRIALTASHLSETISDMSERATTGQQIVQNAVAQMDRIHNETNKTKSAIDDLHAYSDKIETIVAVITEISEQTNLLALNAAIEAARAGDVGRGFAVVADEVRQLADETKRSASDIQQLVQDIQLNTAHVAEAMMTNESEVNQGIERIQEVGETFKEIIASIQSVVREIEEMSAVSEQMSAMSEQIRAAAEEIAKSSEDASGHAQQVASAAEEQLATMSDMEKASESLKTLVSELDERLKQFNV